ncbi:endonuclease/exonuclease/phosphatase family protein [Pseudooceanicola nanhaiensis]|uniref:endonuclease/exonuclease/phosphatase family protein n=1 Tax=Pseudooceanicola nanhaiensis TaxID=375761 RepID=UPI001CD4724F|nr:endonuclease/exonuclease/phosphatase family protein [Pseudooceanicola nanhaiensis]MCA0919049.1 endonuclease/exonuclease/phosphatase family protein [Pseudooceanicola nanhaiensis]
MPLRAGEGLRIAFYHTELARDGPGLLLRDIRAGDAQVEAVATVIAACAPDVLVLSGIDYDTDLAALSALNGRLELRGAGYPHLFTAEPNTGMATGQDLDGDGRLGGPRDAQGYGRFAGQGGMAVLSRWPLTMERDLSTLPWRDLPGNLMIDAKGREGTAAAGHAGQRLSSVAHWVLRVGTDPALTLLAFHATPPVFDGPEDRNGRRNHDEVLLWQHLLDGALGPRPEPPLVLLGDANLDPARGEGRRAAIRALLTHPALQDPAPGRGAAGCAPGQGAAQATVDWDEPIPGDMRVSYVLPGRGLEVLASGVVWPEPGAALADTVAQASRHRLVWARLRWPP